MRNSPKPGNSLRIVTWSMKTFITSSRRPSTRELEIFWVASFFLGDITRFSRAEEGENSDGREVSRMKDDPRRSGLALGAVGLGGNSVSTLDVRTIGAGVVVAREMGRIMTSSPSNVRAESLELSSVSGVTASVLTMTGKRTARRRRMYSEDTVKSLNSEDLECRSAKKRMTVWRTEAWPPTRIFLDCCVSGHC